MIGADSKSQRMSTATYRFRIAPCLFLGCILAANQAQAKTSGTHQNTVRKEVIYSVGGDIREARITLETQDHHAL